MTVLTQYLFTQERLPRPMRFYALLPAMEASSAVLGPRMRTSVLTTPTDEFALLRASIEETTELGREFEMAMMTFINLPVKDLGKAAEFFSAIGFSFDPQFTDENATRMIVSEDTSVMLVTEPFFQGFVAPQQIADTSRSREVIVGLSAESREHVDDLTEKALTAGAEALGEPMDDGIMYMRGFRDLDGHQWSFIYMDLSAVAHGAAA